MADELKEMKKTEEHRIQKMAKSAENEISEQTVKAWAKEIEAKLNSGMEQSISEILAKSESAGVRENAKEIASEICASILSVYKEIAEHGDTGYFEGGERQMSDKLAGNCAQKVLESHGILLPAYPDESGEREKVFSTVMQVSDEIYDFIRTNTYENFHGGQTVDSAAERQDTEVAEEDVAARKTVRASEIFKDFEEGMIFAGISHKDFDRAMLDYLHQRSGREEAENGSFDTEIMFEFLVAHKIHDARARTFALDKIERYKGMTVEFDADNIDLGYLRLSDREGAKEVEKELEELKAAHPILVKNLSGQNENEETVKAENPFSSADQEQLRELYEQAEAVEKMQQEAAATVEFDGNGNPYYPKNEVAEEMMPEASAGKDAASVLVEPPVKHFDPAAPIVYGKTVLPSFAVMASGELQPVENAVVTSFDKKQNAYLIDTGTERMEIPAETFKLLLDDRREQERGQAKVAEGRTIVFEDNERGVRGTVIPEFAMYTQRGLESFKGFVATKFNAAENTYTLRNEDASLVVTAERFKEITAPDRFENHFDENSPAWKKLCETQYDDFFKQRSNTAYNFRHNLSVYCRREANSPCDALHLARQIIRQMPNDEQRRTQRLLQGMSHENESMNELIARLYHEAIKEMPLNEDYIKRYQPEKVIARPFYDTVSENGHKIENDPALVKGNAERNLKIGDTLRNVDIQTGKLFGRGRDVMHFDALKVVSASKEGNTITLMDAEKSFIKLPRDTVLSFYKAQQLHEMKHEQRQNRNNKMTIGYV